MNITRQVIGLDKLPNALIRTCLEAKDAYLAAGGSDAAPIGAVLDGDGKLIEVEFYEPNAVDPIGRVLIGANGEKSVQRI